MGPKKTAKKPATKPAPKGGSPAKKPAKKPAAEDGSPAKKPAKKPAPKGGSPVKKTTKKPAAEDGSPAKKTAKPKDGSPAKKAAEKDGSPDKKKPAAKKAKPPAEEEPPPLPKRWDCNAAPFDVMSRWRLPLSADKPYRRRFQPLEPAEDVFVGIDEDDVPVKVPGDLVRTLCRLWKEIAPERAEFGGEAEAARVLATYGDRAAEFCAKLHYQLDQRELDKEAATPSGLNMVFEWEEQLDPATIHLQPGWVADMIGRGKPAEGEKQTALFRRLANTRARTLWAAAGPGRRPLTALDAGAGMCPLLTNW
eukprot:Hpha_TRINITY_DN16149_c3_g3::TRINITY_DN16149_c3_g3_i1::g.3372::m.3372